MGGKSLSAIGFDTVRLPASQAIEIAGVLMSAFAFVEAKAGLPHPAARLVPAYRSKPDYGDLDIVVSRDFMNEIGDEEICRRLQEATGWAMVHRRPDYRDPVMALGAETPHGRFQIDLINSSNEAHDFAVGYFSWNDTGSLIGRVARQMGMRFGESGLQLILSTGTNVFGRSLVTTDFDRALEFLGFDVAAHRAGFDTVEDIYDFVSAGRYFDPAIYSWERMNNDTRRRARSRPFYQPFLNAITPRLANFTWPPNHGEEHLAEWRERIFEAFPEARPFYEAAIAERDQLDQSRTFFSGARIRELSGVSGIALSHLINAIRAEFASVEEFTAWTALEDYEDLARRVARAAATDYIPDHLKEVV